MNTYSAGFFYRTGQHPIPILRNPYNVMLTMPYRM
jgi:hypothetical protein